MEARSAKEGGGGSKRSEGDEVKKEERKCANVVTGIIVGRGGGKWSVDLENVGPRMFPSPHKDGKVKGGVEGY